jgi:hypothetical protein
MEVKRSPHKSVRFMNTKKTVAAVAVIVLAAAGIYFWVTYASEPAADSVASAMKKSITCSKCGGSFEKTFEEISKERRAHDGHIYCPLCKAEDPDVPAATPTADTNLRNPGFGPDKPDNEGTEQPPQDNRRLAPPAMKKGGD